MGVWVVVLSWLLIGLGLLAFTVSPQMIGFQAPMGGSPTIYDIGGITTIALGAFLLTGLAFRERPRVPSQQETATAKQKEGRAIGPGVLSFILFAGGLLLIFLTLGGLLQLNSVLETTLLVVGAVATAVGYYFRKEMRSGESLLMLVLLVVMLAVAFFVGGMLQL